MLDPTPLYRQVKARIVQRLANGMWKPGTSLPAEHALGVEFGVSPGTVRKALDELTAEHIVFRRQGRGTFVAEPDDSRVLFHFFKLTADDGVRRIPESTVSRVRRDTPTVEERKALLLSGNVRVIRIERVRRLENRPVIAETISVPVRLFPDLDRLAAVPNNIYALYASRYGRVVARAHERIKAANADTAVASTLGVSAGTALLAVERTAHAVDGEPIELRVSLCRTDALSYEVDLC